jgi:hypothetical protein
VLSNYLHVVVRTRPDVVKGWSDEEVALRWWRLFPHRRNEDGTPAEPTNEELNAIRNDHSGLKEKRRRLKDISWFMRCLAEPIARRGNKDDNVTGRFWEGRFRAQLLLDETAVMACMAYVDLNPSRAGIAATPETSDFTSVKERIEDLQAANDAVATVTATGNPSSGLTATFSPSGEKGQGWGQSDREKGEKRSDDTKAKGQERNQHDQGVEHGRRAGWLAPIGLSPPRKKLRDKATHRRASNKGCLPMTLEQYLKLIDWTGRQMHRDKINSIPEECAPVLERLECSAETWLDFVKNFRKRFRNEAGLPQNRQTFRQVRGTARMSSSAS